MRERPGVGCRASGRLESSLEANWKAHVKKGRAMNNTEKKKSESKRARKSGRQSMTEESSTERKGNNSNPSNSLEDAVAPFSFPSEPSARAVASELGAAESSDKTFKWSSIKSIASSDKSSPGRLHSPSVSEPSMRLNPVIAKKMRLVREDNTVIDFSSERTMKAVSAPTDDESMGAYEKKLKMGKPARTDRIFGVFGAMLNNDPVPANMTVQSASTDLSSIRDTSMKKREAHKMPPKRTTWWQVTLYIINDTVGAWLILFSSIILGMYGWILGLVILVGMWPLNLYTAHLLWRCRNVFPGAISIGDLVYYLTRSTFAMYTAFFLINATIFLTLASQIETASSNIYWFFSASGAGDQKCYVVFLAGITAILLPLTQLRYLHSLSLMNALNILCMLIFVCSSIYAMASKGQSADANTRIEPYYDAIKASVNSDVNSDGEGVSAPILGLDIIITAYYYQLIILEVIAEMKDPNEFPKANYWATPVVLFVTIASGVCQYYYQGEEDELRDQSAVSVLNSIFDKSDSGRTPLAYVAIICFTIHMIGCCVIRSVVLTRSIHLLINPAVASAGTWRFRLEWTAISLAVLTSAWALTIFVREISLMSLLTGFLALLTSIVLPVVLYILVCRKRKLLNTIPKIEWILIAFILLFSLATFITYFVRLGMKTSDTHGENFSNSTIESVKNIMSCEGFTMN